MSVIVPNISKIFILRLILNKQSPQGQILRLFKNSYTPSANTVLSDLQEADQSGYQSINLTGNDWNVLDSYGSVSAVCLEKQFNFTSAASIYGYYITTNDSTPLLMWAERFSSNGTNQHFEIPNSGGTLRIVPEISLS